MANLCITSLIFLSFLPIICLSFSPENPTDRRILVLLDDFALKSSHSIFFKALQNRGFELDFKLADDRQINLQRYGQYMYDGLVLFAPNTERKFLGFGGSLDLADVLDFVDSGHDLILSADVNASDLNRNIAAECGVDFDEEISLSTFVVATKIPRQFPRFLSSPGLLMDPSAMVIDHTNYAVSDTEGDHTMIASDDFVQSDVMLGSAKMEAMKVLGASPSAYSANPKSKLSNPPSLTGSAISLVSVVQARNNARIMIAGSLDMFSNRLFKSGVQKAGSSNKYEKSGNEQFVTELSKWVFHERGHLKAVNVRHHKVGETDEPAIYRINDDLEYSVEIFEWSGTNWEPYVSNDVQVQFYMMSPYVLKTLSTNQNVGLYYTSFKVPDVYGVFQFKVEYHRLGYTSLSLAKQGMWHPPTHLEVMRSYEGMEGYVALWERRWKSG
ncbi:hypothetical protein TEA_005451 [Camellia sinensis var. sinensis]|uniref:Dolichyl-diphosphooligosaccharide--protein glycosyltransferase 48 kDa subunit n=1 Tax=Camellia sinensis var. sinensis TaxID=542762 RepID=A0A4S4E2Z8_CAMSN|nr:hypothetical protein TEA_005451 [Camellia sinensis var. sinensis]